MELSKFEQLNFSPKFQLERIKVLKRVLGIENCETDISELELHNIINIIFSN